MEMCRLLRRAAAGRRRLARAGAQAGDVESAAAEVPCCPGRRRLQLAGSSCDVMISDMGIKIRRRKVEYSVERLSV